MAQKLYALLKRDAGLTFPRDLSELVSQSTSPDPYEGGQLEQLQQELGNLADLVGRILDQLIIKGALDTTDLEEIFYISDVKWTTNPYEENE